MKRKILYSPGYGAGWTSWFHGSDDAKRFMLTYPPFIKAIEAGEVIPDPGHGDYVADTPGLIGQFCRDFTAAFPEEDLPYFGGVDDLQVAEVYGEVKIEEYDGHESVTSRANDDGWL